MSDKLSGGGPRRGVCHFAAIATIPGTLALVVTLTRASHENDSACLPDGTFSATLDSNGDWRFFYNPWTTKGLFQITLGFGQWSFSAVKVIDIIWDLVGFQGSKW
jgi:hypothetical protein